MPGILWLASYPKSGNTWLRAFLANLIHDPPEPLPINRLPDHFLGDGFVVHVEQITGRRIDEIDPAELPALRRRIHEWFAHSRPDNAMVKTHSAVLQVDGHPLITPSATAGAIYVIRNPMDVAVSFAHHFQVSYERAVESLGDEGYVLPPSGGALSQHLSSWSTHVRSWTRAPGLPIHVVRYEDMASKPYPTFKSLMDFLNLPADRNRLKKAIRFTDFKELQGQEQREKFVESRPDGAVPFFRSGKVGGWRAALDEELVARLTARHGEVMREFGYIDSDGQPRT